MFNPEKTPKVIEEAPSPFVDIKLRELMAEQAINLSKLVVATFLQVLLNLLLITLRILFRDEYKTAGRTSCYGINNRY